MTDSLRQWCEANHLQVAQYSEPSEDNGGSEIVYIADKPEELYLYLKPFDGKVIDEDFAFILSDDEFDLLDGGKVSRILFEFGGKFYYSAVKADRNKYNEIIYKPEFNDFKYLGPCTEEEIMPYAHLGVHTEYEMLNGSGACELWVRKARFLGVKALGVCDRNTLASSLSFQTACEKEGIKSIIGETVTVARNYKADADNQETFELKLYCINYTGWKNLLLINAAINVDYDKFVPEEFVLEHGEGLMCVIPPESEFNYYIDDAKACLTLINKYKRSFTELRYQVDTREYVSATLFRKHLHALDMYLMRWRRKVRPITISDSYYLDAEEGRLKSMLNKVAGVAAPESNNQWFKTVGETFASYEEWYDSCELLLEVIAEGFQEAMEFADRCDFCIPSGERHLPKFEVPDVEELFWSEVTKGFNDRFGNFSAKEQKRYLDELEKECAVIVPNGLCDYFLILWDIIRWCHDNGIMTGPGRGSVCGSLVAYCLGITDVDPLKYALMFERFLNETRVSGERAKSADSLPDVDVDFPTEYRDVVKEYIKEKYGAAYSCSIATYTRMKLKTCIKDFGKIMGLSFDLTNKLTKDIDDQIEYTWGDLIEYASKSKALFKFVQENPEIVHMTKYAMMVPKSESVHPSAVVIVPKQTNDGRNIDIFEWMPVKKIDGMLVSEWEGKYIDKSGFLKEDILGLSQLDKFSSMLALIRKDCGKTVKLSLIPFDDDEVFRYFKRGWNEDVFQFGTTGLMNYCRQVKPSSMDDLIAMTALFRPGPMDVNAHGDFADIKAGKKKPSYDWGMEDITRDTYSLYVYQEQIMKAVVVGGLSAVESDVLRTTIKKKDHAKLESFGDKFKAGYGKLIAEHGIKNPEEYAQKVWEKLLAFSGYGFNKCIDGDETILRVGNVNGSFVPTISQMYRIKNMSAKEAEKSGHYALRKKYIKSGYGMCFSLEGGRLKRNKIVDIRFSGIRKVYKITTETGKSIRVTANHKFPTPNGVKIAGLLKVGDVLYCNGGYEPTKKKYNFGNLIDNYPKRGQCGFQKKDYAPTVEFKKFIKSRIGTPCDECGEIDERHSEAHHVNGDRSDNRVQNLRWLCSSCHKKAHYSELNRVRMGEKGLLVTIEKIVSIEFIGCKETFDVEVSGEVSHTFLTSGGIVTSNSHAAAYTIMSYWSQWFKVNYPLEFWTTALQYSKEGEVPYRLAELKKTGVEIEVRPPDINFSDMNFTCDPREQRIFFSLQKIKGVGDVAVQHLVATRNAGGQFFSLEEFLSRVPSKVNKTVVKSLIIAGAFDLVEGIESPVGRRALLESYLTLKGDEMPEEYKTEDSRTNAFWILEQKRLTGFGDVDYESMIRDAIPNKRIGRLYVNDTQFLATPEGKQVAVAGKLIYYQTKDIKNGRMCTIQIDCNNTIIAVLLWPDAYEKIGENIEDLKGMTVALSGVVKKDKFKNEKKIYSDAHTRLYVIGGHKAKTSRYEDWLASKQ